MFIQVCSAGSRLLIQESIFDDVVARIKVRMSHLRLGDSLDKTIDMGTLVDEAQRRLVDEMVQSACAEGAQVCFSVLFSFSLVFLTQYDALMIAFSALML